MRSLRGRLSLGIGLLVLLVLGIAGALISNYTERVARDNLDDRLRRTVELSRATAVQSVRNAVPDGDRRLDAVLRATSSSLRLVIGDAVVLQAGDRLLSGDSPPTGLRTLSRDGEHIRVLVAPLKGAGLGDLARLEVASSLADLEHRQRALDRRLLLFGALALLITVLGTFLAAGGVLRPLGRLRRTVGEIAEEEDLAVRVEAGAGPAEVRGLAASFNAMLERLSVSAAARRRALEATRRFALDAGHELRTPLTTVQATLSALHRHPGVPAEQRTEMLGDALAEQRRLVTLLDGLQALARGDALLADPEPVDLVDVVAVAVADVRARHPQAQVEAEIPDGPLCVRGWEPGLRMLVTNLLVNAAHHGGGRVRVTLEAGTTPVLTVDDDGPGIAAADRDRVFEPFERLPEAAGRDGSGLGLALVAQQARVHDATIAVEDSPWGGARFRVVFMRGL